MGEEREFRGMGAHLRSVRLERGLSQVELAVLCGMSQQQVSFFEAARRLPTLDQTCRLARALDVSLHRLVGGSDRPGIELTDLAIELRDLGVVDLRVKDAKVPGMFRRPEEVIALAVSGHGPDPRIIEAIPAVLARVDTNPILLKAYGIATKTTFRLAWLADVALTIQRKGGLRGGCPKESMERFLKSVRLPSQNREWDGLGKPSIELPTSPLWRRWKINYDARVESFEERARHLAELGGRSWERRQTRDVRTLTVGIPATNKADGSPAHGAVLKTPTPSPFE
ncbi:Transcriptional regulator, contains XRE-family HTH domain [Singulisphaera sp. GP187]|uniref:helix-turn-helix domain-containing protein n=1 Tax=Singulisphaera sp. GP187 TaxID=1882752 RepID=UPI0009298DBF|nr:helix-turn-helix transcriptional regulator [Singulisphaera sp. GP187]SIO65382.1 Transcriptional regulator, contains XRE-family HTH domain [Singulisphaera sp. GP187]